MQSVWNAPDPASRLRAYAAAVVFIHERAARMFRVLEVAAPESLELDDVPLPDERLSVLMDFAFLNVLKLVDRQKGYTAETQTKIKALLPKVEVKFTP